MAVPSSGELELRGDIALEVYGTATGSNISLGAMSDLAGFPAPDAMSDFYGYSSADAPSVTTNNISNVSETSLRLNGNVTSDGGATITERGFYFGTNSANPTNNTKYTVSGTTGSYLNNRSGLSSSTTYYCWAFATNSKGTTYGSRVQASTIAAFVPTYAITSTSNYGGNSAAFDFSSYGGEILFNINSSRYYVNPNTGSYILIGSAVNQLYRNQSLGITYRDAPAYGDYGTPYHVWATNALNVYWNQLVIEDDNDTHFCRIQGYARNQVALNFSNQSWDSSGFTTTTKNIVDGDTFQIERDSIYGELGTFYRLRQYFNFG